MDEPMKQEMMTEPLADNTDYGKEKDASEALLKKHDALMFNLEVVANTNKDDLVSKASFSKLIDMTASIPRMNGYELYKTEQEKELARQKMFYSMDI